MLLSFYTFVFYHSTYIYEKKLKLKNVIRNLCAITLKKDNTVSCY